MNILERVSYKSGNHRNFSDVLRTLISALMRVSKKMIVNEMIIMSASYYSESKNVKHFPCKFFKGI